MSLDIERHLIQEQNHIFHCTANTGECGEEGRVAIIYKDEWLGDVVCPRHDNPDGATSCIGVQGRLSPEILSETRRLFPKGFRP